MNPFIEDAQEQGVTYWEHWGFAMGIAYHLLISVMAFAIHAMLPFISIEPRLDLEATANFLAERNRWIETANETRHSATSPGYDTVSDSRTGIGHYFDLYNQRRPHSSLGRKTPDLVYFNQQLLTRAA